VDERDQKALVISVQSQQLKVVILEIIGTFVAASK
jgi:hypothetical protein